MPKAVFEFEKKTNLGEAQCPKCGHRFEHVKVESIPVTYTVKASICHTKDHPTDKTNINVESKPHHILPHGKVVFYPKSADELKAKIKEFMQRYRADAWIFGLGSDRAKHVMKIEQVDENVDKAIEYMKHHEFTPKFV